MSVEVRQLTAEEFAGRRHEAADVFAAALGFGPLEPRVMGFAAVSLGHVTRPGFRAFGALSGDRLIGFSEGYTGAPGQWWYDVVAAHLSPGDRARWLDGCFELVELHVHPDFQRRGLGGRLHDLLLEGLPQPTAVLSTRRAETSAMTLYRRRGWAVVLDRLLFPGNRTPFRILGLDPRRR